MNLQPCDGNRAGGHSNSPNPALHLTAAQSGRGR